MLYTVQEINNILQGLVGNVRIYEGIHQQSANEPYYYIINLDNGKDQFGIAELVEAGDLDGLISAAYETKKLELIRVKAVCMNLIGREVWVDRETIITVESITGTKDEVKVLSTSGRTYSANNLWITES